MSQVFTSLSGEYFESLDEVSKLEDWNLEKAFDEWRHTLRNEKSPEFNQEISRVKERVILLFDLNCYFEFNLNFY